MTLSTSKTHSGWYRYGCLVLIGLVYVGSYLYLDRWWETLYAGDSNGYYLHVVSFFVHNDVGDYDKSISALKEVYPQYNDPREDKYGIRLTEKGRRYIKYTVGVGLLESPFFLIGHLVAKTSSKYKADGWSTSYVFTVGLSAIFYVLLGMSMLFSVLRRYFSIRVTVLTLLTVGLATNLLYQATYVTMSHAFLFFLHALLIYLSVRFYERPGNQGALMVGGAIGLIAITRIPEVVCALVPLLWGVYNRSTSNERITFFRKSPHFLAMAAIGFGIVFAIQLTYWYYVSGQFFFDPYDGEDFNFLRPQIFQGWFHFTNGWLIYTPVMFLALAGIFYLHRYCKGAIIPLISFVFLQAFIHYSYYAWTYFPGFGSRPMVETYPLLAMSLAAFYAVCIQAKWAKWVPITALLLFGALNLFQTWQQNAGIILTERHKKAFFIESFGKTSHSKQALRAFDSGQVQPDEEDLSLVSVIFTEGFEDSLQFVRSAERSNSGAYSLFDPAEYNYNATVSLADISSRSWLEVGISGFVRPEDKRWDRDHCALLVAELYDEHGRRKEWSGIPVSTHIGNTDHSIWTTGEVNMWDTASFFLKLPGQADETWTIKLGIWNPHHQNIYLDDMYIKHYQKQ